MYQMKKLAIAKISYQWYQHHLARIFELYDSTLKMNSSYKNLSIFDFPYDRNTWVILYNVFKDFVSLIDALT